LNETGRKVGLGFLPMFCSHETIDALYKLCFYNPLPWRDPEPVSNQRTSGFPQFISVSSKFIIDARIGLELLDIS
jgi:hypothetical protein